MNETEGSSISKSVSEFSTSNNNISVHSTKNKRLEKLDTLYTKYVDHILEPFSDEVLSKYFIELELKEADVANASKQTTEYIRKRLTDAYTTLKEEESIDSKLKAMDVLIENSNTQDDSSILANGASTTMVPRSTQVVRAHMYKLKREELQRLWDLRDKLRVENQTKMDAITEKKNILLSQRIHDTSIPLLTSSSSEIVSKIGSDESRMDRFFS
ncbi:uncharacterized protein BX664DRAFT_337006 [Halteromyces radiatus]|uniref:uncharacterized protein n=1 Tax=Halteromyces radiatus TaxID=101107 RepID=UPI00222129D3|nr:uncharacterized protein BX664DRAFT_337006 [Halteromyces radiatus]KAI8084445.1 hypothetical protein BX664DRAFT_337006 [Halteromyces radiatus]